MASPFRNVPRMDARQVQSLFSQLYAFSPQTARVTPDPESFSIRGKVHVLKMRIFHRNRSFYLSKVHYLSSGTRLLAVILVRKKLHLSLIVAPLEKTDERNNDMKYLKASEIAVIWNVSAAIVRRYCLEGRVEGAVFENELPESGS